MLWDPIHFLESCPSSDGACAMVLTNEAGAKKAPQPPAWVLAHGDAQRARQFPGRDPVRPQAGVECAHMVYDAGGHHQPARADRRRRALRAVLVVRADVARGPRHRRPGRGLEDDRRRRAPRSAATSRSTRRAACSRRTRSARRACCASPRPRSRCAAMAGEHQVDGATRRRSATPTAARRSTSRCGSSARRSTRSTRRSSDVTVADRCGARRDEERPSSRRSAPRCCAWLDANAERADADVNEFKRRMSRDRRSRRRASSRTSSACKEWQRKLYDAGFAGHHRARRSTAGGAAPPRSSAIFQQESARYEIDTGVFSVGSGMVVPTILAHGTEEQKQRYIPPLLRRRRGVVPAVQRARRRLRPRRAHDARGARRRRVGRERPEGVELASRTSPTGGSCSPAPTGTCRSTAASRTSSSTCRRPGVEVRPLRQITGVAHFNEMFLDRRAHPARERARRGERRLGRRADAR